jgi:hypothetical protein
VLVIALVGRAFAACPNDCSGNGDCSDAASCDCFAGYYGSDCSKRLCSYSNAFIDTPIGDVNGDNRVDIDLVYRADVSNAAVSEQYHSDYAAARSTFRDRESWDEAHFYKECAGKGICNTETGICDCFEGYTGEGCSRMTCPSDCSSHGTCKSYEGTRYQAWDKKSTQYCHCDPGYIGPACQRRNCPQGLDPVEASNLDSSNFQRIAFRGYDSTTFNSDTANTDTEVFSELPYGDVLFTITMEDDLGNEWTTELVTVKYDVLADTTTGSLPFATSAWDTSGADERYYVFPRPLNSDESLGSGQFTTVSDQVENALHNLPHGVGAGATAHAVYVAPNIGDLEEGVELDDYFSTWSDNDQFCTEGDLSCADAGLVGCGVANWWSDDDDDDSSRNGGHDIDWFIDPNNGNCENNVLQLCDSNCETVGLSTASTILPVADSDISNVAGFVYHATPHYDNDLGAEGRLPTFTLQSNLAGDFKHAHYMMDVDQTSITQNNDELAGLSIFIRFPGNLRVTQPLRVDYYHANQMPRLFVDAAGRSSVFFGSSGFTTETCTTCTPETDNQAVIVVTDLTAYREWDASYDGLQKSFLGDGTSNSDIELHICSRRGLCDMETGVCECFGGYGGSNCGVVNALAS